METIWDAIKTTAELMGTGQGFLIILFIYLSMVVIERLAAAVMDKPCWNPRDSVANIVSGVFVEIVGTLVSGGIFIGIYVLLYEHVRLFEIPFVWWGWVLAFLMHDLAYYTDHRLAHRVGFLWALHTTHHSSKEMNFLVANRGTALSIGGSIQQAYYLLPILGLHPAMFLAVRFFANLWGIFNHTRLVHRMGWLEGVLMTPANHRAHHGTEPKYLDINYAQVLMIWDRLFGTFQREEEEPTYGLVQQLDSYKLWDIQTSGFQWLFGRMKRSPHWRDKLMYLIKPPGWSHDGQHETADSLRAAAGLPPANGRRPVSPHQPSIG